MHLVWRQLSRASGAHGARCAGLWLWRARSCAAAFRSASGSSEQYVQRVDRLPIPEDAKQSLYGIGVSKLFDIQAKVFHPILRGATIVGRSKTGSGKTLAYLLPVLERMRQQKMTAPNSVLVLVPTRELCKQVGGMVLSLAPTMDLALVYSDVGNRAQDQQVMLGPRVVIATPGRCVQLLNRDILEAKNVRVLVIDEADVMLSLAYINRVDKIVSAVSKAGLQAIMMSASVPPEMLSVVDRHFTEYQVVDLVDKGGPRSTATVEKVQHRMCRVSQASGERERILLHILEQRLDEFGGRAIIFVESSPEAKLLITHPVLERKARALHAESTAKERDAVLTSFANSEFDVLITTDIVSRGVDFKDVSIVLQLRPPKDAAQYIHRAGRTGRAGKRGVCITLYDPTELKFMHRIKEVTRQKFLHDELPDDDEVHDAATSRLLDELLAVPPEEYEPVLPHAQKLLQDKGPQILATAMAMLDGRRVGLDGLTNEKAPSLLTGVQGYICFHAHDPDHHTIPSEHDVRRVVQSLLPRTAGDTAVGSIAGTSEGWAVDVARRYAANLQDDLRSGRKKAPFELTVAKRLPRLKRVSTRRARRLPWSSMQRIARRNRVQGGGTPHLAQKKREQRIVTPPAS